MPNKSIPTIGDSNWGTPLNAHLSQLQNPSNGGINAFEQFAQRPTTLTADDAGKTYLYTQTGNFHQWTGTAWKVLNESVINVKDYGAVGDGVADDTVKLKAVIAANLATSQQSVKTLFFPSGKYIISDTLRPITETQGGFGLNIKGESRENTSIETDINKPVFDISGNGGSSYDYRNPGSITNLQIVNRSVLPDACAIQCKYTGRLLAEELNILVNIKGIIGAEVISAAFNRVQISVQNSNQNRGRLKTGYDIQGLNTNWNGGYVFAADIAVAAGGSALSFYGFDVEFSRLCFQLRPAGAFNLTNCHFEGTEMFLTNAETITFPIEGTPWIDTNSAGYGIGGAINIIGCSVFTGNSNSNSIVIKPGPGFICTINISGCQFAGAKNLICGSFSPGQLTPLPAGSRLIINGTPTLEYTKPPNDPYSSFCNFGSASLNEINNVEITNFQLGANHTPVGTTSVASKKIPVYIQGVLYYLLAE
jgi:Pectate lyase superfamily protein